MSAVVVGSGITRFGMFVDTSLRELAAEAVDAALADAGLEGADIGLVLLGNATAGLISGQEMIRAQTTLSGSRVVGRPMMAIENACASSSSAFHLAQQLVEAGTYRFIMVVGAEKMTSTDRTLAAKALATATDVHDAGSAAVLDGAASPVFMEIYAQSARDYMSRWGATSHDFALVAAKSRECGASNPIAQVTEPRSPEEILAGRLIAYPLTRDMCAGIGDGAAAVIVCSDTVARERGLSGPSVLASVLVTNEPSVGARIVEEAAERAYEVAGIGPSDIDVVELHDAASSAEIIVAEELGLAVPGGAVDLVRAGETRLDGRIPINPSGGLTARGHPVGATGVAQIVELVDQLRGRAGDRQIPGPRVGLAQNAGGWIFGGEGVCAITVLRA